MANTIKVDIIILGYFSPETTIRTIESVIKHTNSSIFDLNIIISEDSADDNYSKFVTDYLKEKEIYGLVHFIKRETRGGFIENSYTGIEYRESDYKVLLNSDTIVTNGWLEPMIKLAESQEEIAIVNPLSNNAPILSVPFPPGFNIVQANKFAKSFKVNENDFLDITTSVGFCMMIKSRYIKQYGFFDRIFGMGYCEETDLHFRYLSHGLRAVITPNSFVYHRGEGSFSGDRKKLIEMNQGVFFKRWGEDLKEDLIPFTEKTILHRVKEEMIKSANSKLNIDIIFISDNDTLEQNNNKIVHRIVNYLNEQEISANIACTEAVTTIDENNDDRTYTPILIKQLSSQLNEPKLLIFSSLNELTAARNIINSKKYPNLKLGFFLSDYTKEEDLTFLKESKNIFDFILNYSEIYKGLLDNKYQTVDLQVSSSMDLSNFIFKNNKLTRNTPLISSLFLVNENIDKVKNILKSEKSLGINSDFKNHLNINDEIYLSDILMTDSTLHEQELNDLEIAGVKVLNIEDGLSLDNSLIHHKISNKEILSRSDRINLPNTLIKLQKLFEIPKDSNTVENLKNYLKSKRDLNQEIENFGKKVIRKILSFVRR